MGLTVLIEQDLSEVGLTLFFEDNRESWKDLARQAYDFTLETYPDGATIRHDDVAKQLSPVLAVNTQLGDFLKSNKIRGRHWIDDFCAYVLEMTWAEIQPQKEGD
jgi:hypothetical protein